MKWIKVEDDLPPFGDTVLVYGIVKQIGVQMGGNPPRVIMSSRQDLKGSLIEKDWERYQCNNQFRNMESTTHWCYLPKPPKK